MSQADTPEPNSDPKPIGDPPPGPQTPQDDPPPTPPEPQPPGAIPEDEIEEVEEQPS